MDCLLLHTPRFHNFYNPLGHFALGNLLPIGLLPMADYLERQGFTTRVVHLGANALADPDWRLRETVAHYRPRLIGLSLQWHYQLWDAIETVRALKRDFPETPIVLGGLTAGYFAEELLAGFPQIDFIVTGDGEQPLVELLRALRDGGDPLAAPNLIGRRDGRLIRSGTTFVADRAFLNGLVYHRYDLLDRPDRYLSRFNHVLHSRSLPRRLNDRILKPGMIGHLVGVGRGCPVDCSYCGGSASVTRRRPVLRAIDSVLAEVQAVAAQGVGRLYFPIDPYPQANYYPRLFTQIAALGLRCGASFESYRLPTPRVMDSFLSAFGGGPANIFWIGVESGDAALRAVNRGYSFTNRELFDCLDGLAERGLHFHLSYTLGLPGETRDSLAATRALWRRVRTRYLHLAGQNATIINLDPGSPAERDPAAHGVQKRRGDLFRLIDLHRDSRRESLSGWGHLPMGHECPTLFAAGESIAPRRTERFLKRILCRHFCPMRRFGLRYPLNRWACLALGVAFRLVKRGPMRHLAETDGGRGTAL